MTRTNPLLQGLAPTHPGEFLAEVVLPELALSKVELARRLDIGRQTLYDVLGAKTAVTPAMALKLERLLGRSAASWLAMQAEWDLARAAEVLGPALAAIEPYSAPGAAAAG